jgi:hypothetical protein
MRAQYGVRRHLPFRVRHTTQISFRSLIVPNSIIILTKTTPLLSFGIEAAATMESSSASTRVPAVDNDNEERNDDKNEFEFTLDDHNDQLNENDNENEETSPSLPPKQPLKKHNRSGSRGKSGTSLSDFAAIFHDAFDGDLNPFEVNQQQDDDASVGYDSYKPLPIPDPLGNAQFPPSVKHQAPSSFQTEQAALISIPLGDDDDEEAALEQAPTMMPPPQKLGSEQRMTSSHHSTAHATTSSDHPVPPEKAPRSVISAGLEAFKYLYSLALLIFCVVLVMGAMFTQQTTSTAQGFSTVGAFFIFWLLILWLAMMEGGQGALVGLTPIDRSLYQQSHPRAYKISGIVQKGDALEKFIVGRQFLVVLVVFVSQLMSSAVPDIQLWGISKEATEIFLNSGVALMVVTIVCGQLTAQLNAANCMLDFINNYFMLYFVTYLSLAIEVSGLLHCVYVVQIVFAKISGQDDEKEWDGPPRTILQRIFFWLRVLFSLAVLGFAFAVTLSALFQGQTTMWQDVPESVSVILFFLLMCLAGLLEGMQIALFAVVNIPPEDLEEQSVVAAKNCRLTFQSDNLQSVLIGRQILVTICTFVIARITTLDVEIGVDENIFGVSNAMQQFFNTGLLGAVITTIVSSLAWRIIASSFPVAFLSNPLIGIILRICLLLEASGICSSAWVLARFHKPLANYQPDEVYLEGAERHTAEPVTNRDRDIDRFVNVLRYSFSLALTLFCGVLLGACIFTGQTKATNDLEVPSWAVFVIVVFLMAWLATMEGGQGCLIGLVTVPEHSYAESHPLALKSTSVVYENERMQAFIIGRQYLALAVIFLSQWITEPVAGVSVLGLPKVVNDIFLTGNAAVIIVTIILGQLTSQVNAAICMLDFINNYIMLYLVTYLSLIVEWSGALHAVYVFRYLFAKITGNHDDIKEIGRGIQKIFFWCKVVFSICLLVFASAVTIEGLLINDNNMWSGLPGYATASLFVVLICLVGLLEGVQIALFALANLSQDELSSHKVAFANFKLTFAGQNLQAFLVGRQGLVTVVFFIVAQVATWTVATETREKNIFGVSETAQQFFNTGLLGAFVITVLASLVWRLVAASFPVSFMSNPLIYLIIHLCLLVEATGIFSACWVFGRWNKLLFKYQPDDVYTDGAEKQGKAPVTRRDKDIDVTVTVIKDICSCALLGFAIAVTMSLIFTEQTQLSATSHPAVAFVLIWFLLIWLAMMEGGQGCLVGLQGVDSELYKKNHVLTVKNAKMAHKGNNMQRFILGRQFLVVLVVFATNLCGSPLPASTVFGLPSTVSAIFVDSGVSLILLTVIVGQLTAQVNAASCMIDFINNRFMLYFVTYISMIIEASGILHCVYLVQMLFAWFTKSPIRTNEPPLSCLQKTFFWSRVTVSLALLSFAFAVTLTALFDGQTTSWKNVPNGVSVVIFFVLMLTTGLMEGMQIALFAVVNLPDKELARHRMAKTVSKLTFEGNNLQGTSLIMFLLFAAILYSAQLNCTFSNRSLPHWQTGLRHPVYFLHRTHHNNKCRRWVQHRKHFWGFGRCPGILQYWITWCYHNNHCWIVSMEDYRILFSCGVPIESPHLRHPAPMSLDRGFRSMLCGMAAGAH